MANIIGLADQQKALKDISAILKDLKTTNSFLDAVNPTKTFTISFTDNDGKKHATELSGSKEEVDALVSRYKDEMKVLVLAMAEEYHIGLDVNDKKILGIDDESSGSEL